MSDDQSDIIIKQARWLVQRGSPSITQRTIAALADRVEELDGKLHGALDLVERKDGYFFKLCEAVARADIEQFHADYSDNDPEWENADFRESFDPWEHLRRIAAKVRALDVEVKG